METPIKVNYVSTNNALTANQYLRDIAKAPIFAADFEVAVKYSDQDIESFKTELIVCTNKRRWQELNSRVLATALDHPSHTVLTHCSIALNDHEAYVFILDNKAITNRILQFLVSTEQQQIWHNASYDFRQLFYRTGLMPKFYEDTQIFAKSILNHVETHKANSGLKELAGHMYGAWGISADNFTVEQMYEPHVLQYAAIDACATFWLWESINRYVESANASN